MRNGKACSNPSRGKGSAVPDATRPLQKRRPSNTQIRLGSKESEKMKALKRHSNGGSITKSECEYIESTKVSQRNNIGKN